MGTTPIFAEILVVGFEVEAWLALAVLTVFGSDWIDVGRLTDFTALVTLFVVALAYVLGILADRAADSLFEAFVKDGSPSTPKPTWMRMRVMHSSEGMTRFLEYQRSRWRVARATVVNLVIAGPVAAAYVARSADDRWAIAVLAVWVVLVPLTYNVAGRIRDAWVKRVRDAYEIVTSETA